MPPPLQRPALESMKRADLQRLCKDHGLKANLKTEALIDLLLDSTSVPPPDPQPSQPLRSTSTRLVSRSSGSRPRLQSSSSVIIHSDSEDEDDYTKPGLSHQGSEPPHSPPRGPATRTRKAKDAQLKLGVGRPMAAGGSGARAVTKSISMGRSKRGKSSRSAKPVDETIEEEPEPEPSPPIAGPSSYARSSPPVIPDRAADEPKPAMSNLGVDEIHMLIESQTQPLQHRIASLQTELHKQTLLHSSQVNDLKEKIRNLENEVAGFRRQSATIELLKGSLERLESEFSRTFVAETADPSRHEPMSLSTPVSIPSGSPPHPGTSTWTTQPPAQSSAATAERNSQRNTATFEYPPAPARSPAKRIEKSAAQSALGKRQRTPDDRPISGILEVGKEGELSAEELDKVVLRPGRKRPKVEESESQRLEHFASAEPIAGPSGTVPGAVEEANTGRHAKFSVFEGPEELSQVHDTRPVLPATMLDEEITEDDFAFFDPGANRGHGNGPKTSTANAAENQRPFNFGFPLSGPFPVTSTPAPSTSLPAMDTSPISNNFPYPEPPHSPSPAPVPGTSYSHRTERITSRVERVDPFHPFGTPPGSRNPSGSTIPPHDSAMNSLLRTPPTLADMLEPDNEFGGIRRKASSNDVGAGLGMTSMPMRVEETPAGPMRRTMYGTELEGDTRFGDFGVEGVATGFWGR
ncbi:hypothetical protein DENSPDRAFT_833392 [Dentipellis sp. KUC8613]|nr:hypothetical protein DENSPDRAFT_833392 [Dentipellis sp. KUC8613]